MSKKKKAFLIIIAAFVLFSVVMHYTVFDRVYHSDYKLVQFAGIEEEETELMTSDYIKQQKEKILEELGDYEKCKFNVYKDDSFLFVSFSALIVADYTDEKYAAQKEKMMSAYNFFSASDENLNDYIKDSMSIGENIAFDFDINNWQFRIIKEEGAFIPNDFRIFAYNDEDSKIALLSYHDQDLDDIGDNNDEKDLQDFVNDKFKYNFKK